MRTATGKRLQRIVDVRHNEVSAMLLACAYFFFLLASWYILRPVRDEMGVAGGVQNLAWLFTGTLLVTLIANPLFALLVARLRVKRFIPITYRFFMANLLVFFLLLLFTSESQNVWTGRAFFVWTSVFNLFVVSVFWAFMADSFRSEQGKRLFGFIGAGGTLGGIAGAALTASLAERIGTTNLLLVSILLIECAVQCVRRFPARFTDGEEGLSSPDLRSEQATAVRDAPIGGGAFAGVAHVWRSPYLLGICLYMLLFTVGSTFLYFQQASLVGAAVQDRAARTALFARVDLAVNVLTLVTQIFVTGRLLKWLGVGLTLALVPALSIVGFLGLSLMPTLVMVILFQTLRRASNFAVASPTREVLFTVVPREDKYKTKNFIDTFVYRGGDQLGAWSNTALGWFGLGVAGVSLVAAPLAGVWLLISLWLGRKQTALASREAKEHSAASAPTAIASPASASL